MSTPLLWPAPKTTWKRYLALHKVPVRHRVAVRTTKVAERSFEEGRRRAKVIPRLRTERAATKLVFATMMRAG
jgi:transposase-like protein